jgi:hypothetical protein
MLKIRLYQPGSIQKFALLFASFLLLAACGPAAAPTQAAADIEITLLADGESRSLALPAAASVQDALDLAGLELGPLDRTEPSAFEELADGDELRLVRVNEEFEVEEEPLPYVSRTLQNEALAAGEQRLIQNGVNGLQEVTYRLLYEDGELISRTAVREIVVTEPVEEIIMIGAQSPFSSLAIPGRLAFLSAGNAWLLETNTGSRQPVVTSGDLDGRVFQISPDGAWLLFTRASEEEGKINELWLAGLDNDAQIDLGVGNIVHYAGWVPGDSGTQIDFSTVEPSLNPPGWHANNDLQFINFTASGEVTTARLGLPVRRTDSLYSWWGTGFAWNPDGELLAFTRPDAIGLADIDTDELEVLLALTTYQTSSDWAWMPGIAWSEDGVLYAVEHAEQAGLEIAERSPLFDLISLQADGEKRMLAQNVGMFANPAPEPGGGQVAFLRAFTPSQSDISTYELMVAAPSGNLLSLFPPQGAAGLQPQQVSWAPSAEGGPMIAFIYQGNLWVVNILTGEARQLTGDGLVGAVSWK